MKPRSTRRLPGRAVVLGYLLLSLIVLVGKPAAAQQTTSNYASRAAIFDPHGRHNAYVRPPAAKGRREYFPGQRSGQYTARAATPRLPTTRARGGYGNVGFNPGNLGLGSMAGMTGMPSMAANRVLGNRSSIGSKYGGVRPQ